MRKFHKTAAVPEWNNILWLCESTSFLFSFQARTHSWMIYTRATVNDYGRASSYPACGYLSPPASYRSSSVQLARRYEINDSNLKTFIDYYFYHLFRLDKRKSFASPPYSLSTLSSSSSSTCFPFQNISDIVQLAFLCFVLVTILVALQFSAVLHTPWAALAFSIVTTGTVGTVSAIVGGPVAPLPLFALILVN